jgi:hypothetical protein
MNGNNISPFSKGTLMSRNRIVRRTPPVALVFAIAGTILFAGPAEAIDTGGVKESAGAAVGLNPTALARINRRTEEGLVACMKKQGFEYFATAIPVPQDALDGGLANRKAFVEKYGYGLATLVEPPKKGEENKNTKYTGTLSKTDLRAYNVAIFGTPTPPDGQAGFDSLGAKSCLVSVNKAVYGDLGKLQAGLDKYADVARRVNADAGVIKAMRDWSACMKKGGFSYAKDTDVEPDITAKLNKLFSAQTALGNPDPSSVDVAGLTKLKAVERQTAKADWDCSKAYLGQRDKVSTQFEKKFIADNQPLINELKKVFGAK